jgi:hypothetical protein
MDLRRNDWHVMMYVTGVSEPRKHSGSLLSIMADLLKDLQGMNPRTLANGQKEIMIRITDKQPVDPRESRLSIASEVMGEISVEPLVPFPSESFDQFRIRLIDEGLRHVDALQIAREWFPSESSE